MAILMQKQSGVKQTVKKQSLELESGTADRGRSVALLLNDATEADEPSAEDRKVLPLRADGEWRR